MYEKNLTEDFRLRLCTADMDFLRKLANERSVTVSEVVRSIIGEYRRSLETISVLSSALKLSQDAESLKALMEKGEKMSNGDTKTDIND